jgi:FAD/FMN-containing dehydrogenase
MSGLEASPRFSRRAFLVRGLETAAGSALLAAAGGCSGTHRSPSRLNRSRRTVRPGTVNTTPTSGPLRPPPWAELRSRLDGALLLPGTPGFRGSSELYNEIFDSIPPAALARCKSVSDIQACVDFARRFQVPISVRSGGHSFAGYSTGAGHLVVDCRALNQVLVDPAAQSVTVGPGARLIDLYAALASHGLGLSGGSCPTVGIAGLALGGGLGVVDRLHGTTADALTSLSIVLADGSAVPADPSSAPDLFWASRGGGGGNFGVVSEFSFQAHPVGELGLFTLVWPSSSASDVLGAFMEWGKDAPLEVWANYLLGSGNAESGPISVRVTGVYSGPLSALESLLVPLIASVPTSPVYTYRGETDYLSAMLVEAGCDGDTVAQCHLAGSSGGGILTRSSFAARSNFLLSPLSDNGVSAAVAAVTARREIGVAGSGGLAFTLTGGTINDVAPAATAFVHRNTRFLLEYNAGWPSGSPASVVSANRSWLNETWVTMQPYVSEQAYQNYIDPELTDWSTAYYGSNYPRLVEIKSRYDPDNFFHFAQSIPVQLRLTEDGPAAQVGDI